MKRDMDLVRKILQAVEAEASGYAPNELKIEGYSDEEIGYHALLMAEAGLVIGADITGMGDTTPTGMIQRLTWEGHDFLDAARQEAIWQKARESIGATVGGVTFGVLKALLIALAKQQLRDRLGVQL
jgi:hypothetical protein